MRLFVAKESFKYKCLTTAQEVSVLKGQAFLVDDPVYLPVENPPAWFLMFAEYEMLARKS